MTGHEWPHEYLMRLIVHRLFPLKAGLAPVLTRPANYTMLKMNTSTPPITLADRIRHQTPDTRHHEE
jgi:hypothetical protein